MDKDKTYIWYSGATDVTGKVLQQELGIKGGNSCPKLADNIDLVIGWGTKISKDHNLKQLLLNDPNHIRKNRNKKTAMELMMKGGCNISHFTSANKSAAELDAGALKFPLIGRTNFHQGGKGFWTILNRVHHDVAMNEGCEYMQNYIDIVEEYRLHIFDGKVIYAVKKIKRANLGEAFVNQYKEKICNAAAKGNKEVDEKTIDYVLHKLAKTMLPKPDMIIRSNMRGWRFSKIKLNLINKSKVAEQAKKAVKALNLTFGAVDCCIDSAGKCWVLEVNSGPGLQGSTLAAYISAFNDSINKLGNKNNEEHKLNKQDVVKEAVVMKAPAGKAKQELAVKLNYLQKMLDAANDEEAEVINKLWHKM